LQALEQITNFTKFCRLPAIRRGEKFPAYDTTSYNSLLEYDYDEVVFDQDSEFQNVRIMHSKQFGNSLILDNDMSKLPNFFQNHYIFSRFS